MPRFKGGKPRPLTSLQLRRQAYDSNPRLSPEKGYKRPGSNKK